MFYIWLRTFGYTSIPILWLVVLCLLLFPTERFPNQSATRLMLALMWFISGIATLITLITVNA